MRIAEMLALRSRNIIGKQGVGRLFEINQYRYGKQAWIDGKIQEKSPGKGVVLDLLMFAQEKPPVIEQTGSIRERITTPCRRDGRLSIGEHL